MIKYNRYIYLMWYYNRVIDEISPASRARNVMPIPYDGPDVQIPISLHRYFIAIPIYRGEFSRNWIRYCDLVLRLSSKSYWFLIGSTCPFLTFYGAHVPWIIGCIFNMDFKTYFDFVLILRIHRYSFSFITFNHTFLKLIWQPSTEIRFQINARK